jgi:soluble lytic murein transglycosylase
MSNRSPFFSRCVSLATCCAAVAAGVAPSAWGQSPALLEAVRVNQLALVEQAKAELTACLADKRCGDADRLSLLTGALLLSASSSAAAVQQLTARPAPRHLEAFHAWYLGEALAWSGKRPAALKSLQRARQGAPAWLVSRVELRMAELQLELGQAAQALAVFDLAEVNPEVLLGRALARRLLKRPDRGRDELRALVLQYPTHPHARLAHELLTADGVMALTPQESLTRAQALLAGGDPAGCLATLPEPPPRGLAQRVALTRGKALLARGRDAEALAEFEAAASGPVAMIAAEAVMAQAKRLMRLGDNTGARAAFRRVDTSWPKSAEADEAGYLAAWLAMNSGALEVAVADFAAFEAGHPRSKRRDEARWFRTYSLFKLGRFSEARLLARSVAIDFPHSSVVPQSQYWATRAAQLSGGPAERSADAGATPDVLREYREIVANFPGSLYARLALERLRELGETAAQPLAVAPLALSVKTPPALTLATELARAGLLRDAAEEVQAALGTVTSPEQALSFGHALVNLGEFAAAHALAARHLWGAVYTLKRPEAVALMYPRAWRSSVEHAAQVNGVDPHFAWAIMRRESGFRPDVISSADARGLMQVIPPTARQIAAEAKTQVPSPDDLFAPDTNVRLATWYLAALFARLEHPGLVAAAYNGGPSAVVKWVKERGDQPFDQFIEEIPYKETRGYVKQVLADYFIYRSIYGDPSGVLSLIVPPPKAKGVDY